MHRRLAVLTIWPLVVAMTPAAPVPKGRQNAPVYFPTVVGAKWVYQESGVLGTEVVTKVTAVGEGILVSVEREADGKTIPFHTMLLSPGGLEMIEEVGKGYDPHWRIVRLPHQPGAPGGRLPSENKAGVRSST